MKAALGVRISRVPTATPEPHTRPRTHAHGSRAHFLPLALWLSNPLGSYCPVPAPTSSEPLALTLTPLARGLQ